MSLRFYNSLKRINALASADKQNNQSIMTENLSECTDVDGLT